MPRHPDHSMEAKEISALLWNPSNRVELFALLSSTKGACHSPSWTPFDQPSAGWIPPTFRRWMTTEGSVPGDGVKRCFVRWNIAMNDSMYVASQTDLASPRRFGHYIHYGYSGIDDEAHLSLRTPRTVLACSWIRHV